MGSVVYTPGRALHFKPVEVFDEAKEVSAQAASGQVTCPVRELKGEGAMCTFPAGDQAVSYTRLKPLVIHNSFVKPFVKPFYVRNNDPNLQEFEIF